MQCQGQTCHQEYNENNRWGPYQETGLDVLSYKASDQIVKHKATTWIWQGFWYNRVFYKQFQDDPETIEEFVPGTFTKYINNNGECYSCPEQPTAVSEEL